MSPSMAGDPMSLYAIVRHAGWRPRDALDEASERSTRLAEGVMRGEVRWIRSYVLDEGDGAVGTMCIYEATSPEAIRKHAALAGLPVDRIIAVTNTVVVRADPG
jgi:hypothetical protein